MIYADTVGDLGLADELGNYAEYSGAPNAQVRKLRLDIWFYVDDRHPAPEGPLLPSMNDCPG